MPLNVNMDFSKRHLSDIPLLALIIANAVPVFGVLYLGWDAFSLVLLYWAENIVVGFYNVLRIACAKAPHPAAHLGKLFVIPFFMVHYGGFCAVHGFFVLAMFKKEADGVMQAADWPCFFVFLQMLLGVIRHAYSIIPPNMKYAIAALFLSHGVSFVGNYLMKGEYLNSDVKKQMGDPYARVVVLHVAIIAGGFLTMALGSPAALLLVLIVLKTVFDVKLHKREHRKKQKKVTAEKATSA
jgi:hypothetical protein